MALAWRGKWLRISHKDMRPRRNMAPRVAVFHNREDSMSQLVTLVKSFGREEEGQDLLEYALLVALIALIAIGAVTVAGNTVATVFGNIAAAI